MPQPELLPGGRWQSWSSLPGLWAGQSLPSSAPRVSICERGPPSCPCAARWVRASCPWCRWRDGETEAWKGHKAAQPKGCPRDSKALGCCFGGRGWGQSSLVALPGPHTEWPVTAAIFEGAQLARQAGQLGRSGPKARGGLHGQAEPAAGGHLVRGVRNDFSRRGLGSGSLQGPCCTGFTHRRGGSWT